MKAGMNLHNEFFIDCRNVQTGKVEQYKAYNLITDAGIEVFLEALFACQTRWSGDYLMSEVWGAYIHVGEGDAVPDKEDTSLNDEIFNREAETYSTDWDLDTTTATHARRIVIFPEEYVGKNFREVGLSGGSDLHTRALIEDAEGNPITIEKTEFMEVTITVYVYLQLEHDISGDFAFVDGADGNAIKRLFTDELPLNANQDWTLVAGDSDQAIDVENDGAIVGNQLGTSGIEVQDMSENINFEERKVVFPLRFQTADANGTVKELGFFWRVDDRPVFRGVLPFANWTGKDFEAEELGMGTGSEETYSANWDEIVEDSETVYWGGEEKTKDTDYTINYSLGQVTATVPDGEAITMDYSVEYIPKDDQHVLDVEFEFHLNPNPE